METPGYSNKVLSVPACWQDVYSYFYEAANHSGKVLHKTLLPISKPSWYLVPVRSFIAISMQPVIQKRRNLGI